MAKKKDYVSFDESRLADEASTQDKQGTQEIQSKQSKPRSKGTSAQGLPAGWTRGSFIMQEAHLDKLRAIAYWDRRNIKDVVDEIFEAYLQDKNPKKIPLK